MSRNPLQKAEDFKSETLIFYQGKAVPKEFSVKLLAQFIQEKKIPFFFAAIEELEEKFIIAVGFKESEFMVNHVHEILLFLIKSRVCITKMFRGTTSSNLVNQILKNKKQQLFDMSSSNHTFSNLFKEDHQEERDSFKIWTDNLPNFHWDTEILKYSIPKTEIEEKLNLFSKCVIVHNKSPLKEYQNKANERLIFAPNADSNFLQRISLHKSVFLV